MKKRCSWCEKDDLYRNYHDNDWGKPIFEDKKLFEYLTLESFQSGLSWYTILKKREHFRMAFDDFNVEKIARYSDEKVEELLQDKGIIRHRLKILATRNNAQKWIEIQKEWSSFSDYIWHFVDGNPIDHQLTDLKNAMSKNELSDKIAKDLKQRGFKLLGSTTVYSFLQAVGIINDHLEDCDFRI